MVLWKLLVLSLCRSRSAALGVAAAVVAAVHRIWDIAIAGAVAGRVVGRTERDGGVAMRQVLEV